MQKFMNDPTMMVDESISGFIRSCPNIIGTTHPRTVKYIKAPIQGKVGIVSGGGSGHDPAFMGYIGENMLDAVAIGEIFTPPTAEAFYTAFKEADGGSGVICLYGNYPADTEQVEKAVALAKSDGIRVEAVTINDDMATENPAERRGAAGEVLLWKLGGAAASQGYSLDEIVSLSQKALERIRSLGVGLASCIIPGIGRPNYVIEPGTMEIGVGHHGYSSMDICKLRTADDIADVLLEEICKDMPLDIGDNVAVMVSGLGNTMPSELYILYDRIYSLLMERGVKIHCSYLGDYFTSLDMMGVTLTLMRLDYELIDLLDMPAYPIAFCDFAGKK